MVTALSHLSKSVQTDEGHCKVGVCSGSTLLWRQLIPFQSIVRYFPPLPSPSLPFPPIPFPPRKSSIFPQMRPSPSRNVVKISTLKKIIIRDKICWYRSDMVFRSRKNPDRFGYSEPVILCHSCHYNLQDPVSVEWKSWVSYWVNFIHSDSMTHIVWRVILRVSNGM